MNDPSDAPTEQRLSFWRKFRQRWGVIVLVGVLFGVGALSVLAWPAKHYVARVTLKISAGSPPSFTTIQSEIHAMTSQANLRRVVQNERLAELWGIPEDQAVTRLSGVARASLRRGTDLSDLQVSAAKETEAVQLVNALADTYIAQQGSPARASIVDRALGGILVGPPQHFIVLLGIGLCVLLAVVFAMVMHHQRSVSETQLSQ